MNLRRISILLGVAVFAVASAADATVHKVRPGDSIQAAVDAASPGDTILVWPGTYTEPAGGLYGVHVTKNNLRLIGKSRRNHKVRLLANLGQQTGVFAAPPGCDFNESSCSGELQNFYIRGFTVEGFPKNGIQTRWVDGFRIINNRSVDNLDNGLYPTLSANGLVANNASYGSLDTALWVAGSENVRVIGNELVGAPTGLEITVSNNVLAVLNDIHDNSVGVGLYHPNAAGNPQLPVMENWVIAYNKIYDNNIPNPALPGTFQEGLLPGYGVLLLGVSDHFIGRNWIDNNNSAGVGVLGWCTATALGDPNRNCVNSPPQADPSSNNNRVYGNWLTDNGSSPPPQLPLPGVDILYFQTPPPAGPEPGIGNCFEANQPSTFTFFSSAGVLPTDGC